MGIGLDLSDAASVDPRELSPAAPPPGLFRTPAENNPWKVRALPGYERIKNDLRLLAPASRTATRATNPFVGEILVQPHGDRMLVAFPPALPLTTEELDLVHELPYTRTAHSSYREPIPAMDRVRASIQINRGCFGGCTFCAIASHQGRDIQSRSEQSILREAELVAKANKGIISDLGGPTANTWKMKGKDPKICRRCRRPSCLYPDICPNLDHDHASLRRLMAAVRRLDVVRKVVISSGVRHDLALHDPRYVEDLLVHHVGGHLHVAPEHSDPKVLRLAKKPPYEVFEKFRRLFERIKAKHHLRCYLNPYFVTGLPGSTDQATRKLTRLLRSEGWKPRQVQSFIPTPGTPATAMFASGLDPDTGKPVVMPRSLSDKIAQHRILTQDLPSESAGGHEPPRKPRAAKQAAGRRTMTRGPKPKPGTSSKERSEKRSRPSKSRTRRPTNHKRH